MSKYYIEIRNNRKYIVKLSAPLLDVWMYIHTHTHDRICEEYELKDHQALNSEFIMVFSTIVLFFFYCKCN